MDRSDQYRALETAYHDRGDPCIGNTDVCSRCRVQLATLAAFCRNCGLTIERHSPTVYASALRIIADRQRTLLQLFALYVPLQIAGVIVLIWMNSIFGLGAFSLWLIVHFAIVALIINLAAEMKIGFLSTLLLAIVCMLPVANLFVVSMINDRATRELGAANVPVGLFGAARADVELLLRVNRCNGCGYDLRGLSCGRCPKCGLAFSPPKAAPLHSQIV